MAEPGWQVKSGDGNQGNQQQSGKAEAMEGKEVMNLREAAQYLGISPDSLGRYAAQNKVPGFKFGNRWRFKKSVLDLWMESNSYRKPTRTVISMPKAVPQEPD